MTRRKTTADTPLNPRQAAFVDEFPIDLNGTQAAIRAGYSKKSAPQIARDLLARPHVAKAIQEAKRKRAERTNVTQDMVIEELRRVAFLDPRRVMSWGPDGVTFVDSESLTKEESACVVEAGQTITKDGGSIRVKLADKMKALELLGRHLGMFEDKLRIDADVKTTGSVVFLPTVKPPDANDSDTPPEEV